MHSVPAYCTIIRECPDVLRGLYSIGYAPQVSLSQLWHTLGRRTCEVCGDYGGYIYLLTCGRTCFRCFWADIRYCPLQIAEASKQYGLSRRSLEGFPTMRSVPGCYTGAEKARLTPLILVDRGMAFQRALEVHGSEDAMWAHVKKRTASLEAAYQDQLRSRQPGSTGRRPRRPSPTQPTNGPIGDPRRYMAVVQAPHIANSTAIVQYGRYCRGCRHSPGDDRWRRKYHLEAFVEHLREQGNIVSGRHEKVIRTS